jgi:uncharacterized protein
VTESSGHGRDRAAPWTLGETEDVVVEMTAASYVVPAGHRLRLAVSTTYWPWVWPHGDVATLRVDPSASRLDLPLWNEAAESGTVMFDQPEQAAPLPHEAGAESEGPERQVSRVVDTGEWILTVDPNYGGTRTFSDGLRYTEAAREVYRIKESDPLSASATSDWRITFVRGGWRAEVTASTQLTATYDEFVIDSRIEASDADGVVAKRVWRHRVPRTSV